MEVPDKKICKFIDKHHVLTLATTSGQKPWCCNCFYAYNSETQHFVFTSEEQTRHIDEVLKNPYVAGSIVLETKIVGKIQGLQFEGKVFKITGEQENSLKSIYIRRFPFVILKDTPFWGIEILYMKYTDNRLGFGKKIIWNKE
jgi:uncharacterized protein YhbP (UPF0306 family)